MKTKKTGLLKPAVHIVEKTLLQPYNPLRVNLIGAGGTGSQVLTALGRINYALRELRHPGLSVTAFDDDRVERANLGRQLFTTAEVGQYKAVALINRINLFFGTGWKAVTERFTKELLETNAEAGLAEITVSCVDSVAVRFEIAGLLTRLGKASGYIRHRPLYWMDFGNSRASGQVVLSTLGSITQPASKKFNTRTELPLVTEEFGDLLRASETADNTPSCSLAEALNRQDLFINSALAQLGSSLLWQLLHEGILHHRGFFLNLNGFQTHPLKVS